MTEISLSHLTLFCAKYELNKNKINCEYRSNSFHTSSNQDTHCVIYVNISDLQSPGYNRIVSDGKSTYKLRI